MKLVLAGGRQGRTAGLADRDHRPLYDLAVLAELDPATLALRQVLTEPVGRRFGAPSIDGGDVVVCTEGEVLRVRGGAVVDRWTHPSMDDLHHAAVIDGRLLAVATGLDGVLEGEELHPVGDRVHPNYVFAANGRTWVTRGTAGDARCLDDGRTVPIASVVVHDGIPDGETAWFTAVDGRLVHVDLGSGRALRTLDLHQPDDGPEPLGWCRGLAIVDGVAWVGFTRIRATRVRRNLAWVRGRLRGVPIASRRPTRVVGFELATGRRVASVELAAVGIDALFGIAAIP